MDHTFSSSLVERMHKQAKPFESIESVVHRALDALEALTSGSSVGVAEVQAYDPNKPPDLTYTKPLRLTVNEETLKSEWNILLAQVIRLAGKHGLTPQQIKALLTIPAEGGTHVGPGFRYVKEADLSFQGQSARRAWEQVARLAPAIGATIEAEWEWYPNPKAIKPGEKGRMTLRSDGKR